MKILVKQRPGPKPIGLKERFDKKYDVLDNGCWIWNSAFRRSGYGTITIENNKKISAHRASYILHKGKVEGDFFVLHTCDNKSCVNPDHLYLGTQKENMQDRVKRGRIPAKYKPRKS